jgi:hypothetical protein
MPTPTEMPDGHLRNAIACAQGRGKGTTPRAHRYWAKRLPELLAEAQRRGLDHASSPPPAAPPSPAGVTHPNQTGDTLKDETGKTYGRLTVLSREGGGHKGARWLCECRCGKKRKARGVDLRTGRVTSCGCAARDALKAYRDLRDARLSVRPTQ